MTEELKTDQEKLSSALAITDKLRELTTFDKTVEECNAMVAMYMPLKVESVDDKEGLTAVHNARMTVKQTRVDIDNRRKELKRPLIDAGKYVETEAKKLIGILTPVEQHLQEQEDVVKREKERLEAEAKEKRDAILIERMKALLAVGAGNVLPTELAMWDDDFYAEQITAATDANNRKLEQEEKERKEREKEQQRLQAQKDEQDRIQKELDDKQAALDRQLAEIQAAKDRAAQERLANRSARLMNANVVMSTNLVESLSDTDFDAAISKAIEDRAIQAEEDRKAVEREKSEAAELARKDTEQRIAREAQEKLDREKAAAEKVARKEARRPWREKVAAIVEQIECIEVPKAGKGCGQMRLDVLVAIDGCVASIREVIKEEDE